MPWFVALLLLAVRVATASTPSTAGATSPAWAFHGGGALRGQAPDLGAPPMKLRWSYHADEDGDAGIEGAAAIVDGLVYVADAKGALHAIDVASGKRRWIYQAAADGFATTPLVAGGKVLIGDLVGVFHAVAADSGKKLWTLDTGAAIHASANAADASASRIIVSNDAGKIFCVQMTDGKVAWTAQAEDRINSAASIVNDTAYIAGCDAKLLALNLADGKQRFVADIGGVSGGSPAVIDGRIIVGTDGGRVVCLSGKDGAPLWSYEQVEDGAMVYASPAVAGGIAVVGARDGKPMWTFKTRLDVDSSPVISSGRVYVGSKDKSLYVLDLKSGQLLWEFKSSRGIVATPAIGAGVLVIGDNAGNVYCLEAEKDDKVTR